MDIIGKAGSEKTGFHALAGRWRVSQAEVVRRALTQAERQMPSEAADPLESLKA